MAAPSSAAILDETAQFRDETSAAPDIEVMRALVPSLMTTGGMVLGISSPFAERGLLYEKFRDHYGKDDPDVLVLKGSTRDFNPTISDAEIDKELAADPDGARAEWLGEFRSNLPAYIDRATLEYCVDRDVHDRPFQRQFRTSASSIRLVAARQLRRSDRSCRGRAHDPRSRLRVASAVRTRRRGRGARRPSQAYSIKTVIGDAYAAGWCDREFQQRGIAYVKADKDKSAIYLPALPMLTSGNVRLLDNPRLFTPARQFEPRVRQGRPRHGGQAARQLRRRCECGDWRPGLLRSSAPSAQLVPGRS